MSEFQRVADPPHTAQVPPAVDRPRVVNEPSLGDLLSSVTSDLSELLRKELELAKAEATQSAQRSARVGGMFAGAALGAFFVLMFLSIGAWWAIGESQGLGWSAVIVAAVWAVVAAVLALVARAQLRKVRGLPATTETLAKIPNSLQGKEEQNR